MNNWSNQKKIKILVIDDSPEIQELIKMSLEIIKGWSVMTAYSALEGIEMAYTENHLDLIILDYLIPKMNGEKILQKLQDNQQTARIPVIFLTAECYSKLKWRKMGARGVIYKPFNPLNLGNLIEDFL